jgi:hypothetical protein
LKKKSILIIALSLALGLFIGGLAISIYFGNSVGNTIQIMGLEYRADWEKRAFQAYQKESPDVAIWALENLADILQRQASVMKNDESLIQKDLVLTYARLAIACQAKGNMEKCRTNLQKSFNYALEVYSDEFKTEQELLKFVKNLDKVTNNTKN